jgi:hypothetical protein
VTRPPDADLLRTWERGRAAGPVARGLVLLAAADPDHDPAALAALTVGERDGRLLDLRQALFGPRVEAVVHCPACRAVLEVECRVDDLRAPAAGPAGPVAVRAGGADLTVRLPDSLDLAHAAAAGSVAAGRRALFDRCVTDPPADPADEVVAAVAAAVAAADPQAAVALDVTCPACGAEAAVPYDAVGFLWREVDAWAARTFGEVHALAAAYGWTEDTILALAPRRRRVYLELVSG